MTVPAPAFAMRRRRRQDGSPILVAVVPYDLALHVGDELLLRRFGPAGADGPEFILQVVRGPGPLTEAERARLAADDMTGTATRDDGRTPESRSFRKSADGGGR